MILAKPTLFERQSKDFNEWVNRLFLEINKRNNFNNKNEYNEKNL